MSNLKDHPNIGDGIVKMLNEIGIYNFEQLKNMGSKKVVLRLYEYNHKITIQTLFQIEGCLRGIRWYELTELDRYHLKSFYKSMDRLIES